MEAAVRVRPDGTRLTFLLNHADTPVEVAAGCTGTDLLTGEPVDPGRPLRLDPLGVRLVSEAAPPFGCPAVPG